MDVANFLLIFLGDLSFTIEDLEYVKPDVLFWNQLTPIRIISVTRKQ